MYSFMNFGKYLQYCDIEFRRAKKHPQNSLMPL